MGGHCQDSPRAWMGAEGHLRGRRGADGPSYRVLAGSARVGPGVDREGNTHVVRHVIRRELGLFSRDHVTAERYQRKIKTREERREIVGARPRERGVIMCHGAYDVLHPGDLRHLLYARGKADLLVASLTSDSHISKANYRPFVPQQLRAMNLAALELVDYVIVDENATPLENIAYLQPDYFAKGYEYFDGPGGVHPKTQQEIDVLSTYGGEMIFTPGDVVFSSSRFIESSPPAIE